MSLARLNLALESEEAVNRQILTELSASYVYLSMSAWFGRDDVALQGLSAYYKKLSMEEREHADMLINYLSKRGGRVSLFPIPAPEVEWKSAMNILECTLKMEKDVTQSLMNLTKIAQQHGDEELSEFITSEFLHEQVDDIKRAADNLTQLQLAGGSGLGLYLFDKNFSS